MSQNIILSFTITICLLIFCSYPTALCQNITGTTKFVQTIDSAMDELAQDIAFSTYVSNNHPFSVPTCLGKVNYPSNPFPASMTEIRYCTHILPADEDVWSRLYMKVGEGLTAKINAKYNLNLKAKYVGIDTDVLGYFPSLRAAVDDGRCHVVVSDTTLTSERQTQVYFPCPYGFSSNGFLRTDLDSNNITGINTIAQLNRPDVKVSYFGGTIFDAIVNSTIPKAQLFPSTYDGQFALALNRQVHAVISDAVDLNNWKVNTFTNCSTCYGMFQI